MQPSTRFVLAALFLAAAGAVVAAWRADRLDVISSPASVGPVVREIIGQSRLQAAATVDVTAPAPGEVQALEADESAAVKAGDIIARIDPAPFEQALRDARATLTYLEGDEGAPPSRIADAQVAVRSAAQDLEHTLVRPVDGVVVARNVSVGQLVTTGDGAPILYRIATDLHQLQLGFDVPASEIPALSTGADVVLTMDGGDGSEHHGTVSRVAATTTIDVPNADLQLRPGAAVTAAIVIARRDNVLRVPTEALTFSPPRGSVSMVDGEPPDLSAGGPLDGFFALWRFQHGRLTPIAVRVGLSGGGWTEIDSGLNEGDAVATGVLARRAPLWSAISIP